MFCADVEGLKLFADAPGAYGGNDAAMTPPQALVATLANCAGLVVAITCKNKGIAYEGMSVAVTATMDPASHCLGDFKVKVCMPGELTDELRRTVEAAQEMCVIGNTMCAANTVDVSLAE